MILRVNEVLNKFVILDSDWRFGKLCGSHLLSQWSKSCFLDFQQDKGRGGTQKGLYWEALP